MQELGGEIGISMERKDIGTAGGCGNHPGKLGDLAGVTELQLPGSSAIPSLLQHLGPGARASSTDSCLCLALHPTLCSLHRQKAVAPTEGYNRNHQDKVVWGLFSVC